VRVCPARYNFNISSPLEHAGSCDGQPLIINILKAHRSYILEHMHHLCQRSRGFVDRSLIPVAPGDREYLAIVQSLVHQRSQTCPRAGVRSPSVTFPEEYLFLRSCTLLQQVKVQSARGSPQEPRSASSTPTMCGPSVVRWISKLNNQRSPCSSRGYAISSRIAAWS
jgi:hypothetical protein